MASSAPHLLLVAPTVTGHLISLYSALIANAAVDRGWMLSLLIPHHQRDHPSVQQFHEQHPWVQILTASVPVVPKRLAGRPAMAQLQSFVFMRRGYRTHHESFDSILVLSLDYCDKAWAILGSPFGNTRSAGILTRAAFLHRSPASVTSGIRRRLLRHLLHRLHERASLRALGTLDPVIASELSNGFNPKVTVLPEARPVVRSADRNAARSSLGLTPSQNAILLYGSISERKGLGQAISGCLTASNTTVLIVAGAVDATAASILEGEDAAALRGDGRLLVRPWFHNRHEEAVLLAAADWMWLGYPHRYTSSSGALELAVAAHLPTIATRHGIVGDRVGRFGLGLIFEPDDQGDVTRVIRQAAACHPHCREEYSRRIRSFHEHSSRDFGNSVCDFLITARQSSHGSAYT